MQIVQSGFRCRLAGPIGGRIGRHHCALDLFNTPVMGRGIGLLGAINKAGPDRHIGARNVDMGEHLRQTKLRMRDVAFNLLPQLGIAGLVQAGKDHSALRQAGNDPQ